MKLLLAVDSITTLNILLDEVVVRSWPKGTEARVLSVVEGGEVPLEMWPDGGYGVVAILCAAMFVLSGGYVSGVTAQDEGMGIETGVCQTSATCKQSSNNLCFCEAKNGDCAGCYVPNGGTGCGSCSR